MSFFEYILMNKGQVAFLILEHIQLSVLAVGAAVCIGVPFGVLISHQKKLSTAVMGGVNLIQAIPSLALLGAAIPLLGIGKTPAVLVVMLYSLLPIVKNTYTGIGSINPETIEAAHGIGLTKMQVLTKVQIPLALPVIMAGVRIAAVTAVGLMTIAAFIGAGGLGFLVFSGISTVNNNLILAGAIPACLLALLVDYVAGNVEKLLTTANSPSQTNEVVEKRRAIFRKTVVAAAVFLGVGITGYFAASEWSQPEKKIVVAGKNFTEQRILAHLLSDLIEHNTDIRVERKLNLGGTQICFSALVAGEVDMYVDYSGTAYSDTLGYPPITDMEKVYQTVKQDLAKKFSIATLSQMAFNNTYTLSTTQEVAEKFSLKAISDLQRVASQMESGFTFEFINREDGMPGLKKQYGVSFRKNNAIEGSQRYLALANGEVQIIDAFSTDGLLKKFSLVTLEDDKNFFPPYYAIPLIREDTAAKYPMLTPLVEKLGKLLTAEAMMDLNYRVDELQLPPREVALEFLKANKLIQ